MFNAIKFFESQVSGPDRVNEYCKAFVKESFKGKENDLVLSNYSGNSFYLNEEKTDYIKFGSIDVRIVYDYKYELFETSLSSGLITYEKGFVAGNGGFKPLVRSVLSDKQINVYNQESLRYLDDPDFQPFVSPDASRELSDDEIDSSSLVVAAMVSEAQELVNSKRKVK